jgi:hypothetical protein
VSISGQALVFVVRTARHSLTTLAGGLTYLAFFGAQVRLCVCVWAGVGVLYSTGCMAGGLTYLAFFGAQVRVVLVAGGLTYLAFSGHRWGCVCVCVCVWNDWRCVGRWPVTAA